MESKEILEKVSRKEITKDEAEAKLIGLGCDKQEAAHLVYLSTGGDDVVDSTEEIPD